MIKSNIIHFRKYVYQRTRIPHHFSLIQNKFSNNEQTKSCVDIMHHEKQAAANIS